MQGFDARFEQGFLDTKHKNRYNTLVIKTNYRVNL
jgi:hypothetical protein